uniref:Uncharacterized protein n=1 Tax=Triticum urartu TaxID=4572 RepID=A0A8R7PYE7_TRIUA
MFESLVCEGSNEKEYYDACPNSNSYAEVYTYKDVHGIIHFQYHWISIIHLVYSYSTAGVINKVHSKVTFWQEENCVRVQVGPRNVHQVLFLLIMINKQVFSQEEAN